MTTEIDYDVPANSLGEFTGDLSTLNIGSVECCGWYLVYNFNESPFENKFVIKDLKEIHLNKSEFIKEPDSWEEEIDSFPLHAVLTDSQEDVYKEHMIKYGWEKLKSWYNPNTENICNLWFYSV